MSKKVLVYVVHHEDIGFLQDCLGSLMKNISPEMDILLVDTSPLGDLVGNTSKLVGYDLKVLRIKQKLPMVINSVLRKEFG